MKKLLFTIVILSFFSSCNNQQGYSNIDINLDKAKNILYYSDFVDSLSYISLNTNDSCLIAGIRKIHVDGDTLIVTDNKSEGVLVFSMEGEFIKHIHYIGQGPTEYNRETSVGVDKINNRIGVYSIMDRKINKYTYQGEFVSTHRISDYMRDFEFFEDKIIMIAPWHVYKDGKSGVWITDLNCNYEKSLLNDVPRDHEFEYTSTYYVQTDGEFFYYDRNYDRIYLVDKDSTQLLYPFEIKQKVPYKKRLADNTPIRELEGCSMMHDFCVSPDHILISYYIFKEFVDENYKWVWINRENNTQEIYKQLINDIDNIEPTHSNIFYMNDSTWCRVIQAEYDCNTTLQFLHLRSTQSN